ncbi:MAG TPA: hypothetical protein VF981_17125 [Gemmatimonadaceae bacterium]
MTPPRTLRNLGRAVRQALARPADNGTPFAPLDLSGLIAEPPRLRDTVVIEAPALSAVPVTGPAVVGFTAFLDGTQTSHVVDYAGTVPVVAGRTAAVVRIRVDRRLTTWGDGARTDVRLYAPVQLLPERVRTDLEAAGLSIRDTLRPNEDVSAHPIELMRRAVDAVKDDREVLERELAELWSATMSAPLYVDGGLPSGARASVSPWCVGVVKSHHTIYVPAGGLPLVMGLREGERTTATLIDRTWGPQVVSWYLRLREPPSHDPFLGLVRVEVARTSGLEERDALAHRADEVSRWILAERAPLSLPDARWDRMVYGIRDCEEYLRATTG